MLLILGAPASGKTQLADTLVARYNLPTLRKDEFKELLFERLGAPDSATPGAWSRTLSDVSFALLFTLAPRLLRPLGALLLEGNFRPGEHEPALAALLAGGDAQLAQVLCHARIDTRAARLQARAGDPRRHPGHRDHAQAATDRAATAHALDGFLALAGPRLRFDSDAARERELHSLCALLDAWMAGDAGRPDGPLAHDAGH